MWMFNIKLPAFLISCLLCLTEQVIPRQFRVTSMPANADIEVQGTDIVNGDNMLPPATSSFQPTSTRCCHIGERIAKKKMICNITMLTVVRRFKYENQKHYNQYSNRPLKHVQRGRLNKLSEKVAKCSLKYPNFFEKCCRYKLESNKHLKKCEEKPKKQRRKCKQIIKKQFS